MRWRNPQKAAVEIGSYCDFAGIPMSALFSEPATFSGLKAPDELKAAGKIPQKVWDPYAKP